MPARSPSPVSTERTAAGAGRIAGRRSWALRMAMAGLASGIAGTLGEAACVGVEQSMWCPAPYRTPAMATRLAHRVGVHPSARAARVLGALMRCGYGHSWGLAAYGLAREPRPLLRGAALGTVIFATELVVLPGTGAAPPLRRWAPRHIAADLLNTVLYGEIAVLTAARLRRQSSASQQFA